MRMRTTLTTLIAVLGLTLTLLPATTAGADPRPDRGIPPGLTKCHHPPHALCGTIEVPLDRTGHTSGTVTIGFEYYRPTKSGPTTGTIVAHQGGPGYSTTDSRDSYLDLFAPMMDHRALLLVDERGTGLSDPINCPEAQSYDGAWVRNAAKCGKRLGDRSDLYNTAAAAQDMADVLDSLDIDVVDLYGDSYGSFFSQTFATRFPDRVHSLVLDGTYPIDNLDPWYATTATRLRQNLKLFCAHSLATCAIPPKDVLAELEQALNRLRYSPLATHAPASNGKIVPVTLTPRRVLDTLLYTDVTPGYVRETPAALVAFNDGNVRPLARMVAEVNGPSGNVAVRSGGDQRPNGALRGYSEGAYLAYACTDYPTLWNVNSSREKRRAQFERSARQLPWSKTQPWTPPEWVGSDFFTYDYCIGWPKPHVAEPPFPGGSYPDVPTLVLNGDLDLRTDVYQARQVAENFPNSTYVEVPNNGHITAIYDADKCASVIVRRFMRTLDEGDTSCLKGIPEHRVVRRFAERVAQAPQAQTAGKDDDSRAADRRAAYVAVESVSDVVDRWYAIPGYTGVGLYGGKFSMYSTFSDPFVSRVWTLKLHGIQWTRDVKVSGKGSIPRANGRASMDLTIRGAGTDRGTLHVKWMSRQPHAEVTITGRIGGRHVHLTAPAPSYY